MIWSTSSGFYVQPTGFCSGGSALGGGGVWDMVLMIRLANDNTWPCLVRIASRPPCSHVPLVVGRPRYLLSLAYAVSLMVVLR